MGSVVKIAGTAEGTFYVNSEIVPIGRLGSQLDQSGDITEVWYTREGPDEAEPHENAMKFIGEVINRRLPMAMYLDREFKRRANLAPQ